MLSEADFLRLLRSRAGASSLATNAFMADKKNAPPFSRRGIFIALKLGAD